MNGPPHVLMTRGRPGELLLPVRFALAKAFGSENVNTASGPRPKPRSNTIANVVMRISEMSLRFLVRGSFPSVPSASVARLCGRIAAVYCLGRMLGRIPQYRFPGEERNAKEVSEV